MAGIRPIRVLLAAADPAAWRGVRQVLEIQPDLRVVGEAGDGQQALDRTGQLQPDVLVMDVNLPVLDGITAARWITGRFPRTRVVGVSEAGDPGEVREMLKAGARGCLLRNSPDTDFVAAIREVFGGRGWLSPDVCPAVLEGFLQVPNRSPGVGPPG